MTPQSITRDSLPALAKQAAIGASLRYLFGVAVMRVFGATPFPLAIIGVNVLGSILMGVFVVAAAQRGLTHLSPLVMTGLLGGFTTFSAFSLETVELWQRGALGHAMTYAVVSTASCVVAAAAGIAATRGLAA